MPCANSGHKGTAETGRKEGRFSGIGEDQAHFSLFPQIEVVLKILTNWHGSGIGQSEGTRLRVRVLPVVSVLVLPPGRTRPLRRRQRREPGRQPLLRLPPPAGAVRWEGAFPRPVSGPSPAGSEAGGRRAATNPGHFPWPETAPATLGSVGGELSSSPLVLSDWHPAPF